MKKSKFNYFVQNEKGDTLVMNILTNKVLKIEKQYLSITKQIFKKELIDESYKWIEDVLIDKGIMVEDDFNENKILQMRESKMIYGDETLSIEIIPTYNCNFRCKYCFENTDNYEMSDATEAKIIKFLEKRIPKCKEFRMSWFGGEPLLCKDRVLRITKKIHEICKKNKIPMYGEMSTNGYLLDVDTFLELIKHRILEFQICLDGTREIHNNSRPHYLNNDSYEVIIRNLLNIKNTVKSGAFRIGIRTNITPQIEGVIEEHLEEIRNNFGDDARFLVIFQCVRNWGGERISQEDIVKSEQDIYKRYYELGRKKGLKGFSTSQFVPLKGNCRACRKNGFVIDPYGNIQKCTLARFSGKYADINRIGYINEFGDMCIDEKKEAEWIVNKQLRNQCKECILLPMCMGGSQCPYSANIKQNNNCIRYMFSMIEAHILGLDEEERIESLESLKKTNYIKV